MNNPVNREQWHLARIEWLERKITEIKLRNSEAKKIEKYEREIITILAKIKDHKVEGRQK